MANYNLYVDTSNFKPYDISTALDIMNNYSKVYEKEQEYYDNIAAKMGELQSAIQGTEKAKGIYDTYNSQLMDAMEQFGRGRNVNTARELNRLRKMYGEQVIPLETARKSMLENTKLLKELSAKDPSLLHSNLGNLDDYLADPNRMVSTYSGKELERESSEIFKNFAKRLAGASNYGRLDPYTKTWVESYGLTPEQVDAAIQTINAGGIEGLKNSGFAGRIIENILNSSGILKWGDENTVNRALGYATRGLNSAIGEEKVHAYEDYAARQILAHNLALKRQNAAKTSTVPRVPTSTYPLHFTDKAVAGNMAKQTLAKSAYDYLSQAKDLWTQEAFKQIKQKYAYGKTDENDIRNAVIEQFSKNGILKSDLIGNDKDVVNPVNPWLSLNSYLQNVLKNNNMDPQLAEIFTSGERTWLDRLKDDKSLDRMAYIGYDPAIEDRPQKNSNSSNLGYSIDNSKFNELATNSYSIPIVGLNLSSTQNGEILQNLLYNKIYDGQIPLYKISDIDSSTGQFKHNNVKLNIKDLPRKEDGKTIDWNKLHIDGFNAATHEILVSYMDDEDKKQFFFPVEEDTNERFALEYELARKLGAAKATAENEQQYNALVEDIMNAYFYEWLLGKANANIKPVDIVE